LALWRLFERNLAVLDPLSSGPRLRFSADNSVLVVQRRRYELSFQDHACFWDVLGLSADSGLLAFNIASASL